MLGIIQASHDLQDTSTFEFHFVVALCLRDGSAHGEKHGFHYLCEAKNSCRAGAYQTTGSSLLSTCFETRATIDDAPSNLME